MARKGSRAKIGIFRFLKKSDVGGLLLKIRDTATVCR